jgi:hypothetical protein
MKKSIKVTGFLLLLIFVLWRCSSPRSGNIANQNSLPTDVLPSCTVSQDSFNTWFASGKATENGLVTAANSVAFPHNNNCDFYQWSERMFLWTTSPEPAGGSVLESPLFYDVTADSAGNRKLIPHSSGVPLRMSGHITKNGPNNLPVITDKTGRLLEIENPGPETNARTFVKNTLGQTAEVAQIKANAQGKLQFLDRKGNQIANPKAIISHKNQQDFVRRFRVGNKFVFLDAKGNTIQSEAGQATDDVLMSQHGSLVYYITMVNDVYAYYMLAAKQGKMDISHFPTTAGARDSICAFAKSKGVYLPDSNALAIEIKASWVEASTLPNPSSFYTIKATIPTYDTTNSLQWTPKGEKTVLMAMVGIHIVGSVAGHPEMIWSTFEHKGNTPNASYDYLNASHQLAEVKADTGGGWTFNRNAIDTPTNIAHMVDTAHGTASDTIYAISGHTISASNTLRLFAWGSAKGQVTNPEDKSSAASNSEVISINNSIQNLLVGNDKRKNYLFIGATWTNKGAAPNGKSYSLTNQEDGAAIGTNILANSTMETYFQLPTKSCFTCHSQHDTPTLSPNKISHIFAELQPFIYNNNLKKNKKTSK